MIALSVNFGSGGGFTGAVNQYIIDGKGSLKVIAPFSNDTTLLTKLTKKELKIIFKSLESKALTGITLDEPGNMTNFINFNNGKEIKKYQWAEGSNLPQEITELFNKLNKYIKK